MLEQLDGQIAIDESFVSAYSDIVFQQGTWTALNVDSNKRFVLNTVTNFTSYSLSFNISHKYESIGLYNLTLNFVSSNLSFVQTNLITDCKFKLHLIIYIYSN